MFSYEYCEIFKKFFYRKPVVAASVFQNPDRLYQKENPAQVFSGECCEFFLYVYKTALVAVLTRFRIHRGMRVENLIKSEIGNNI